MQGSSKHPLIINTPGWVLGTGLEILVDLITKIEPTSIIYMSQEGPQDVVDSLQEAAQSTMILALPSMANEYTTRTAAHLRAMQYMSYFHLERDKERSWTGIPLTSMPPWEIDYAGDAQGILGIMRYGDAPPAHLLADTINGSIVAIVEITNHAAILKWTDGDDINHPHRPDIPKYQEPKAECQEVRIQAESLVQRDLLEKLEIVRTPEELPYFDPTKSWSLDPALSQCIGLVLIRGIDLPQRRLQVLTPLCPDVISKINDARKSIVLVSGSDDIPGWVYIEAFAKRAAAEKYVKKDSEVDEAISDRDQGRTALKKDMSFGDSFNEVPWVERLHGSQGRGIGSRVWRIRRDLGRRISND